MVEVAAIVPVGDLIKLLKYSDEGLDLAKIFGRACSFSGDTKVVLADGTTKPIAEVEVGDWMLAADPETGERGPRQVSHLWVHDDVLVDLGVDGATVTTTDDHPFWNVTDESWQRADALDAGDLLLTASGATVPVDGIDWSTTRAESAYNLTIGGLHTYYVVAGDTPVLVHNTSGCEIVARSIQSDLGGEIWQIGNVNNRLPLGSDHPLDGGTWFYHQFVVADGLVYDALSVADGAVDRAAGIPLEVYLNDYFPGRGLEDLVHVPRGG